MKAIERLFVFFEKKSLKHTPVEKDLGLTNGYLGKMRDRKGSIGSDILETIFCKYPELNPDWLLTGRGTMIRSTDEQPSELVQQSQYIQSSNDQTQIVKMFMDKINEKDAKIEQLQTELRSIMEEVTTLKVKLIQYETSPPVRY